MLTDPQVGDTLGSFRLVQKLGEGGMGVVFKAEDESLGRFVAVKILFQGLDADGEFIQRFLREAESAGALNHPNIVRVYFVGQQEDRYYLVMEFVEGSSLDDWIDQHGPLPEIEALEVIRQAALGLQHALKHDIIHRDIKPDNLLLTSEGEVKIVDFGLAKRVTGGQSLTLTAPMTVLGTPTFMSPEQALGDPLDHRTDIYSLGCTLYYLLTNRTPCEASTVMKILMKQIEEPPVPIERYRPETSPAVRHILEQMLAKNRNDRHKTYDDLIADLELAQASPFELSPSGHQVVPLGLQKARQSFGSGRRTVLVVEIVIIVFLLVPFGFLYFKSMKIETAESPVKQPSKAKPAVVASSSPIPPTQKPAPPPQREPSPIVTAAPDSKSALPELASPVLPSALRPTPPIAAVEDLSRWANAINLLSLLDPQKDGVSGKWEVRENGLWSDSAGQEARLEIPYQPPEEYDFRIQFTPRSGRGVILQFLHHSEKLFAWVMDRGFFGFEMVQEKDASHNPTRTDGRLELGRRYESVIKVRKDGVEAFLDGHLKTQWLTDYKDVSTDQRWGLRNSTLLALGHWKTEVQFQSIEVAEITGHGIFSRPNDSAAKEEEEKRIKMEKPLLLEPMPASPKPPEVPKPTTPWLALDISTYYKADVIASDSSSLGDHPFPPLEGQWATTSWLKKNAPNVGVLGFPDNGQLEIPRIIPRGFFEIPIGKPNAFFLSAANGKYPMPVTIDLSPGQLGNYRQLEFLHGGVGGSGRIQVTLHYVTGQEEQRILQLVDQSATTRLAQQPGDPLPVLTSRATNNLITNRNTQLYAQAVGVNPRWVLKGMTLSYRSNLPPGGPKERNVNSPSKLLLDTGDTPDENFAAVIFAISALRVEK